MHNNEYHESDEALLLAADGEPGRRSDRVRTHLETCGRCRSRAALMKSALMDIARAEKHSFDAQVLPIAGPRALLRMRLAEASPSRAPLLLWYSVAGGSLTRAFGMVALAAFIVATCLLAFRQFTPATAELSFSPQNHGVLPNPGFTPGSVRQASLAEVCSLPKEEVVAPVPAAVRRKVFSEYGIPIAQSARYELDYLITPGLGGGDDIRNLWPEPYDPAKWNAYTKDVLEERLHEMVCSRKLALATAQEAISTDWIAAYKRYVEHAPGSQTRSQDPSA